MWRAAQLYVYRVQLYILVEGLLQLVFTCSLAYLGGCGFCCLFFFLEQQRSVVFILCTKMWWELLLLFSSFWWFQRKKQELFSSSGPFVPGEEQEPTCRVGSSHVRVGEAEAGLSSSLSAVGGRLHTSHIISTLPHTPADVTGPFLNTKVHICCILGFNIFKMALSVWD